MNPETALQNEILAALSAAGCLVTRQHVGVFRAMHSNAAIRVGVPGMADIGALVPVTVTPAMVGQVMGAYAQIEVKTASGRQSKDQAAWEGAVRSRGGIYVLARSVPDALRITTEIHCI